MQAIILAAGMGKRLRELTRDNTKCMVEVGGQKIIDRMLAQLDRLSLRRIVMVVGYQKENLMAHLSTLSLETPLVFLENPVFAQTNNIYSLSLAKDYLLEDDTLLLESDLLLEDGILQALLEDPRETLAVVDKYESWMDGTVLRLDEEDNILDFIPKEKFRYHELGSYYKTVNLYKFSRTFSRTHYVPFLTAYTAALGNNAYYEQVLRVIAMLDDPGIKAMRLHGQQWYEIDDAQDLDIAASLFAPEDEEKLERISRRYGGYWRYPHLTDFCYLVNPYYPPKKLVEEMQANFETLLTNYPSGMEVCSLLAAKNFGLSHAHVAVGNGAAELIKALLAALPGKIGVIRPTFEEYPNRCEKERLVTFTPQNEAFSYTAKELMDFFGDKELEALVLINPDNPSGHYLPQKEVLSLVSFFDARGVRLILDESFSDFAIDDGEGTQDERDGLCGEANSFLRETLLRRFPSLVVVKSISKSHGVPGARLGVMASGDEALMARVKREMSIWNINAFGEFYLQIAEKYKQAYRCGLRRLRAERKRFAEALGALPGVRVLPSQANYLMVELPISARGLTKRLLLEEQIFIKDLTAKVRGTPGEGRQFVRLAVRGKGENDRLLRALGQILAEQASPAESKEAKAQKEYAPLSGEGEAGEGEKGNK